MSEFTINISVGPVDEAGNQRWLRFSQRLEAVELERMRQLRNDVKAKAIDLEGGSDGDLTYDTEPYREYKDVWMNYIDEADLERWMSFIAANIVSVIDRVRSTILQQP